MQTLAQIEFDNLTPSPDLQAAIDQHISELERRFGRVTAGRIIVRGPGDHHKTGGQYQVSIRLALPEGREVNVGRTPEEDERYADLTFAVDDAFRRARRELQDQVGVMHGQTKLHEAEPIGTVLRIDPSGEFGFLEATDGHEVYFNSNCVLEGRANIAVGVRVSYVEELGEKGPQASTVKLLGKHGMRA